MYTFPRVVLNRSAISWPDSRFSFIASIPTAFRRPRFRLARFAAFQLRRDALPETESLACTVCGLIVATTPLRTNSRPMCSRSFVRSAWSGETKRAGIAAAQSNARKLATARSGSWSHV